MLNLAVSGFTNLLLNKHHKDFQTKFTKLINIKSLGFELNYKMSFLLNNMK